MCGHQSTVDCEGKDDLAKGQIERSIKEEKTQRGGARVQQFKEGNGDGRKEAPYIGDDFMQSIHKDVVEGWR